MTICYKLTSTAFTSTILFSNSFIDADKNGARPNKHSINIKIMLIKEWYNKTKFNFFAHDLCSNFCSTKWHKIQQKLLQNHTD